MASVVGVPRRHDHDAGGDAATLDAKAALRDEAWAAIRAAGATRFPGPENRIPNFVGAEAAAERLRTSDPWQAAATLNWIDVPQGAGLMSCPLSSAPRAARRTGG